jgi:hypothetical protein
MNTTPAALLDTSSLPAQAVAAAKRGRPAKYANAAERQAAFRARNAVKTFAIDGKVAPTIERLASQFDMTQTEALNHLLKFALANRNWTQAGMTGWAKTDARCNSGKRALPKALDADLVACCGI